MKAKISKRKYVVVELLPSEVKNLKDDDIIIVRRAQLNAQLAFISYDINSDEKANNIQIIRRAINNMLEQEKKQKNIAIGARMTVSDVKKVFPKYEKMPKNSFARVNA